MFRTEDCVFKKKLKKKAGKGKELFNEIFYSEIARRYFE